jgi:hypothetical protein
MQEEFSVFRIEAYGIGRQQVGGEIRSELQRVTGLPFAGLAMNPARALAISFKLETHSDITDNGLSQSLATALRQKKKSGRVDRRPRPINFCLFGGQFTKALPLSRNGSRNRRCCLSRRSRSRRSRRSGNRSPRNGSRNPGTRNLGTRNHRNPTPSAAGRCRCFPCRTDGMSPG